MLEIIDSLRKYYSKILNNFELDFSDFLIGDDEYED
jgi:hypothetical protein